MSSARLRDLESRRQWLLGRCEEQRLDLAARFAQLRPGAQLTAWRSRRGGAAASPLSLGLALLSVVMMLRRKKRGRGRAAREVPGVGWAAAIMALASRTTSLLRLVAQLRALYLGLKAARHARSQPHVG